MADEENKPEENEEETFGDIAEGAGLDDDFDDDFEDDGDDIEDDVDIENDEFASEEEKNFEADIDDIDFEDDDSPKKPKAQQWIDFNKVNFKSDFYHLFRNPLWIIIFVLAILVLLLFVLEFMELNKAQSYEKLKGYVLLHKKTPKWFKGELSPELEEVIHEHHRKKQNELRKSQIIKDDARPEEPLMGDFYPGPLSADDIVLILESQNIGQVSLQGAEKPERMNLSGLNMTRMDYTYFNEFIGSNLRYANFNDVNLRNIKFRGASMQFSQFVEAQIQDSDFSRTHLSNANFFAANLSGSKFLGAMGEFVHFHETNLSNSKLTDVAFRDSDFEYADLSFAVAKYSYFEGSNFRKANLQSVDFRGANLKGVSFVGANLRGVNFTNANLEGANLKNADIKNAIFDNADVVATNFEGVKHVKKEQMQLTKFLLSAHNLPESIIRKQKSFRTRFKPPREVDDG